MTRVVFWASVLLLFHTYFLYPLVLVAWDALLQALARLRQMRDGLPRSLPPRPAWPRVSLVVAAYNEERCIADKLAQSLALEYPPDRLEVVIGSDGSTDATEAIVRQTRDPRVRLSSAPRAGKSAVLNRCIPCASGEIVVLSDANTVLAPDALKKLVAPFVDPDVGAVCGRLRLYNPTLSHYEESAYWAYESLIKLYEGRRGTVMGANGGIYAIRRSLFEALPPGTIVDDFIIPMRILERGYQVRYEPEALATEETTEDYGREFGRRARIAAGNFQSLPIVGRLLLPGAGFAAFAFWSHKVLRWCAPALMGLALVSNALLAKSPFFVACLAAQFGFYSLAALSRTGALRGVLERAASMAYYFVAMNAAIAVGFWRFIRRSQKAAWDRTPRLPAPS